MKGLVLVKQVPGSDSPFRLNGAGTWIDESNLTFGLNDYDRYALEEALRLKDAGKLNEVVALTLGPERASTVLRTCLATGADRAIHLRGDDAHDPLFVARAIAETIRSDGFSLILAGLQADDDNHGQVGALLARLIDRPCATAAMALSLLDEKTVRVERELENNRLQVVELTLPAVVTVQTGINEPRYASLKGIMAAKKKEIKTIEISGSAAGGPSGIRTVKMTLPPKGQGAEILKGSADEVAKELLRRIREKTGVI
jgi:electron transfer flavoprotein beta subunit